MLWAFIVCLTYFVTMLTTIKTSPPILLYAALINSWFPLFSKKNISANLQKHVLEKSQIKFQAESLNKLAEQCREKLLDEHLNAFVEEILKNSLRKEFLDEEKSQEEYLKKSRKESRNDYRKKSLEEFLKDSSRIPGINPLRSPKSNPWKILK